MVMVTALVMVIPQRHNGQCRHMQQQRLQCTAAVPAVPLASAWPALSGPLLPRLLQRAARHWAAQQAMCTRTAHTATPTLVVLVALRRVRVTAA